MSDTLSLNTPDENKKSEIKKKAAAMGATAAAGAGLGVAGMSIAEGLKDHEETNNGEKVETIAAEPVEAVETVAETPAPQSPAQTAVPDTEEVITEPQPITAETTTQPGTAVDSNPSEPIAENPTPGAETNPSSPEIAAQNPAENNPLNPQTPTQSQVNPDEIAEAIIAEEHIDPNDIDEVDIINFEEIGEVYTVNGESLTAAAYHDLQGNNLLMVDIDGDNVFDVVATLDGVQLGDLPLNISVGDAQEQIEENDVYLAYDEDLDNADEYGTDELADDLLT